MDGHLSSKEVRPVSIIGAGRLGTSLGSALIRLGYRIAALSCRKMGAARESRDILGQGSATTNPLDAVQEAGLIFLTVPDDSIADVAGEIAQAEVDLTGRYVYHCSGLLPSSLLHPLKTAGASIASFHPVQSFPAKTAPPGAFRGITFGLEGDEEALIFAGSLVDRLGGRGLRLKPEDKPIYHTACSLASNFTVILLNEAIILLNRIGLDKETAWKTLFPLMQGTLHNINKFDRTTSLTGPLARGDLESVKAHLNALRDLPALRDLYLQMAGMALDRDERVDTLSQEKIKALKDLLEEK